MVSSAELNKKNLSIYKNMFYMFLSAKLHTILYFFEGKLVCETFDQKYAYCCNFKIKTTRKMEIIFFVHIANKIKILK